MFSASWYKGSKADGDQAVREYENREGRKSGGRRSGLERRPEAGVGDSRVRE